MLGDRTAFVSLRKTHAIGSRRRHPRVEGRYSQFYRAGWTSSYSRIVCAIANWFTGKVRADEGLWSVRPGWDFGGPGAVRVAILVCCYDDLGNASGIIFQPAQLGYTQLICYFAAEEETGS